MHCFCQNKLKEGDKVRFKEEPSNGFNTGEEGVIISIDHFTGHREACLLLVKKADGSTSSANHYRFDVIKSRKSNGTQENKYMKFSPGQKIRCIDPNIDVFGGNPLVKGKIYVCGDKYSRDGIFLQDKIPHQNNYAYKENRFITASGMELKVKKITI